MAIKKVSSSLSVFALVALIVIISTVSSESNPRNDNRFSRLNKVSTSEDNAKRLSFLDDYEGSGDDNYYYDDDDDYDDDDYDEEIYDYGNGQDIKIKHTDESVKFHPDPKITHSNNQDIHFGSDDDLLGEYYEEYDEEEYEDYDFTKNLVNEIKIDEEAETKINGEEKSEEAEKESSSAFFNSYIYITLAAAALSFLVLAVCFVVCRKSVKSQRRRVKATGRPDAGPFVIQSSSGSGPIVKNYKSVPTNDFLTQPPPPSYEMALTVSDKLQRDLDNSSAEERERLNA